MPTPEQVRAAVDTYVNAWVGNDRDAWLANFAEDAYHVDPPASPPNVGREAIGAFWDNTRPLAERYEFDVKDVIVAGDEAVLIFTLKALTGDAGIELDAVDVFTIDDDGRICREKAYFDFGKVRPIA